MHEVLISDSRLGTCVAIVQFAVNVEASSSTGVASDAAAAVVVVSPHSIGSGLRVIARAEHLGMAALIFLLLNLAASLFKPR